MFIFKQHEDTPDDDYDYLYCTTDCSMKINCNLLKTDNTSSDMVTITNGSLATQLPLIR